MTKHPEIFASLGAPFEGNEVKSRTQAGRTFHYVTARTVMNRLDAVLGPENWWDDYTPHENSVLCRLSVRLPDGSTLTKCDAGGYAGMADSGDDDKSGYSDAFKRAAVKFGVGRYLYRDGVPAFAQDGADAGGEVRPHAGANGHANGRPSQATPDHTSGGNGGGNAPARQHNGPPRSGKALFAWTKEQEQRFEVDLLRYINQWAKLQDFPGRMVDWDDTQVSLAYREAVRKLDSVVAAGAAGRDEPGSDG